MSDIPRDAGFDSSLALLREGYSFIDNRCRRLDSDVFRTRLMFRDVVCMQGEEAARFFYADDRFTRRKAMPPTALFLLQDKGSVQQLDGAAHKKRKRMFMSMMTPRSLEAMTAAIEIAWRSALAEWENEERVVLFEELERVLCRAVCAWAGVPLEEREVNERTRELAAMIEGAGAVGPRSWRGMALRARAERWMRGLVARVRSGALPAPKGSPLEVVCHHRDAGELPLEDKVVAVEMLNVLRPTVAVARFIVFAALALHDHPEQRPTVLMGDDEALERFVQEVRRFYPFFPFVGGRARHELEWRGHRFAEGTWVILDLHGTNHDARAWGDPEVFRPERFKHGAGSAFSLIPQGGGDHFTGHRCAGEWLTIEIMKTATRLLTTEMRYEVPAQDLRIDLTRIPALPESRFVIERVQRTSASRAREVMHRPHA